MLQLDEYHRIYSRNIKENKNKRCLVFESTEQNIKIPGD